MPPVELGVRRGAAQYLNREHHGGGLYADTLRTSYEGFQMNRLAYRAMVVFVLISAADLCRAQWPQGSLSINDRGELIFQPRANGPSQIWFQPQDRERATHYTFFRDNLYIATYRQPQNASDVRSTTYIVRSSNPNNLNRGGDLTVYSGRIRVRQMLPTTDYLYVAFEGPIYRSPDGTNVGIAGTQENGVKTQKVYSGVGKAYSMLAARGGIYTAFDRGQIYFSPDGQNLGGGGRTIRVYGGRQKVTRWAAVPKPNMPNQETIWTQFDVDGIYESFDGLNVGAAIDNTRRRSTWQP